MSHRERIDLLRLATQAVGTNKMNAQDNKSNKIDFQELSDSEKTEFIKELKEVLHEKIEEAKFWRTLIETDGIIVNGQQVIF